MSLKTMVTRLGELTLNGPDGIPLTPQGPSTSTSTSGTTFLAWIDSRVTGPATFTHIASGIHCQYKLAGIRRCAKRRVQ